MVTGFGTDSFSSLVTSGTFFTKEGQFLFSGHQESNHWETESHSRVSLGDKG